MVDVVLVVSKLHSFLKHLPQVSFHKVFNFTGCVGSSDYISIHNMCAWMIDMHGSDYLKEKYLHSMTKFDLFSSYCLTEPDSGSDAQAMKSFAKDMGDHFVLNGSKAFISGAGTSDLYVVMCKTGEKEVSCLLLEKGM